MFSKKITDWYNDFGRSLPWRGIDDPYKIWLSEIILQQTRIEQGRDYYLRFIETFPTVMDLAHASEQEVLKLWQGLGYYSRARNLHAAARYIADDLGGVFPNTHQGILALKGVGRYTAAAIASFAFKLPYPVIDGNVYRFISRLYGITTPINSTSAYNEFETLLNKLIDRKNPDIFNQAIMDFGSLWCKPTQPNCDECPFRNDCIALRQHKVDLLPVKSPPVAVKERWFYYFHLEWQNGNTRQTLMHQRQGKDIWKGLYEFPLYESPRQLTPEEVEQQTLAFLKSVHIANAEKTLVSEVLTHKLTHRTIRASFVHVFLPPESNPAPQGDAVFSNEEIKKLPISRLIDRYLTKL